MTAATAITATVAAYLMMNMISSSISSVGSGAPSKMDNMTYYALISEIGSLISLGCMLAFLVGLLGLAIRYGATAKRVEELETISASLMSERDQASH